MTAPLIEIAGLSKRFDLRVGAFGERSATVHALDDFTATVIEGETLSLVGNWVAASPPPASAC